MASNTSTSNNNESSNEKVISSLFRLSECIPWLVVGITECLAIVILNIITIIVFLKQRQLQRWSTYLIIHLAIVDLLTGMVSGPVIIEEDMRKFCQSWGDNVNRTRDLRSLIRNWFPMTSLVNLAVISLERLHATFYPFKHRFIKKRVYVMVISAIWLITTIREILQFVLFKESGVDYFVAFAIGSRSIFCYWSISLFVIFLSYTLIFIKVRCSSNPQHLGRVNGEHKLTCTLVLVTCASFFSWLPFSVFEGVIFFHMKKIPHHLWRIYFYTRRTFLVLAGANSLLSPVVYAFRMPGFREGVTDLLRRPSDRSNTVNLPLRNL